MNSVCVKRLPAPAEVDVVFRELRNTGQAVLLDSVDARFGNRSEYSIIALFPTDLLEARGKTTTVNGCSVDESFFDAFRRLLKRYPCGTHPFLPFTGGAVGYLGYELSRTLEDLPEQAQPWLRGPDARMHFFDNAVLFRHSDRQLFITGMGILRPAEASVAEIAALLTRVQPVPCLPVVVRPSPEPVSLFSDEDYQKAVQRMREYIRDGHIYIANMTHTFRGPCDTPPEELHRILRAINPAPFGAFLPYDDLTVISSSPERFIRVRQGVAETRPIKGTRPRGATPEADEAERQALACSEKDRSELLMIVDLERNDFSRVCKAGSVKVPELFAIETYATVHHLVATVTGELEEGRCAVDLLEACFPGGSITGAPKLRAMEIIEELEPLRRHLYTGCIGYFGYDGQADTHITIRTLVLQDGMAAFGVGGGVTWESDPAAEYQETLDKAAALVRALGLREDGSDAGSWG